MDSESMRAEDLQAYLSLTEALQNNNLTVDKLSNIISQMRDQVQSELSDVKETPPQTWLSILSFFIPFVGIVRKWYQDQHKVYLQARVKNLTLIYSIFTSSKKVQEQLEKQLEGLKEAQAKNGGDERRWMQ